MIVTVLNEAGSLPALLDSIAAQERPPDEVVIVDGGSTDGTPAVLERYRHQLPLTIVQRPGCNISQGRNAAIEAATGEVIAATDAGVRLEPAWLKELLRPFARKDCDAIVCGFFVADTSTTFERAMGATVLPNVEDVGPATFLPSSRSVAFPKKAWRETGGYPEWLDYCEDLVFDIRLKQAGYPFLWTPKALVHFRPRSSLGAFFRQYYRYSRGDGKANLWLRRHLIRYASYGAGALLIVLGFWLWPLWALFLLGAFGHLYWPYQRLWPTLKDLPFLERIKAILWVPVIRVTGDIAKMVGYPAGLWWRLRHRDEARW